MFQLTKNQTVKEHLRIITKAGTSITKKVPKADEFELLNEGEKIFVFIDIFEKEMKNGDFDQFFFNSSGQFTHEILAAYESIGAHKTATIIYQAICLFSCIPVPKNSVNRRFFLNNMPDKTQVLLRNLNANFRNTNEDILAMLVNYIYEHPSQFDF